MSGSGEGAESIREVLQLQLRNNFKQYAMFIALLGIWLLFTILTGGIFVEPRNLTNLFLQASHIAILAVGMVLVIVAGHIDLSVGSLMGFIGAIAAILQVNYGWDTPMAVLAALVVGALVGLWQGYWIAYRGIPAFIVTLAGMTMFRGALIAVTGGATIAPLRDSFRALGQDFLPRFFTAGTRNGFHVTSALVAIVFIIGYLLMDVRRRRASMRYGFRVLPRGLFILKLAGASAGIALFFSIMIFYRGVPYSILLIILLVLLYTFLTNNTVFGRHVYAIGGNREAARLSGINIRQRTMMIFVSMGLLSALSGVVFTARLNAAAASAGNLVELDTIAAAIIGGASTLGGEGTVFGAIIGAILMASVNNGMSLMNLSADWQMMFRGLILLLAVWFDISSRQRSAK